MNRGSSARPLHGGACRAAAGALFLLWIGIFALTACPQLHERLHKDAQCPDHQCLITQIQHQQLLAGSCPVPVPAAGSVELAPVRLLEIQTFSVSDYRLSPSRAPPAIRLAA
jgi:hypothetical protein